MDDPEPVEAMKCRPGIVFVLLVFAAPARAHVGMENSTEVRLYQDRTQVVVRTSYALAWKLLGGEAPLSSDEAELERVKPLLEKEATGLFEVSQGGEEMHPQTVSCRYELNQDVAFVLRYAPATRWPLRFKAGFLRGLGSLDSGTIAVFDQRKSPNRLEIDPISGKVLRQGDETFSVASGAAESEPPAVVPMPSVEAPSRKWGWKILIGVAIGIVLLSAGQRAAGRS